MAFCRLVFTVLLISVSCYANHVPVFLWGDLPPTSFEANALEITPNDIFASLLKNELRDQLTVVFIEETLSTEDLTSKTENGETAYPFLESNLDDSLYLPSVESPLAAIELIANSKEADRIDLTDKGLSAEIQSNNRKYLFINLRDAKDGESRIEMLKRHNDIMEEMFEKLKSDGKEVVAVYTGRYPSWSVTESHSRQKRQAAVSNDSGDYILDSVRLYVELLQLREGDQVVNLSGEPSSKSEISTETGTMNTTVTFGDRSFVMNFRTAGGYWYLDAITVQGAGEEEERRLTPAEELFAVEGFSYRCGQITTFGNTNASRSLVFNNLHVQPFFAPINETVAFGDAFDCVGFFSGPIWAGLLVTFIILIITFYGIIMMMDIKTMDRFDDPKGKTITINASE